MPGTSEKERAIEVAGELTNAITKFKHAAPLKKMCIPRWKHCTNKQKYSTWLQKNHRENTIL